MKIWNVGIYARVSTDKKEQSESIPAQVDGLKRWIIDKSREDNTVIYNLVEVYEDYGFSGSNFERDSFIRMKEHIEAGKINMVLTRDLSRFSRNYVLAGYYLEDYFKVNGVRFVSVLDNVDSESEFDDIIPFKNILNEMYIKDCSRKIKDALKQRMLRGSSIASKPPYGYRFQSTYMGNVKTIRLIPAEDETTEVIKEIFRLYEEGFGAGKIANCLNKKAILPPSAKIGNRLESRECVWNSNTILSILKNPKYGGYMVQQRYKKISYKIKKVKPVEKSDWIWGGEFEGIIDKVTFNNVQNLIAFRSRKNRYKGGELHLFSTVLQCGECNGGMCYRKSYRGYKCTKSQTGGKKCTAHSIKEEFLKEIITTKLRESLVENINKEALYEKSKELLNKDEEHKEFAKIKIELKKIDSNIEIMYEDKLKGILSERNFENLIKSIEEKQKKLIYRKEELEKIIRNKKNEEELLIIYKNCIDKILEFNDLDRQTVEALIQNIIIYEKEDRKMIEVEFKFSI